MATATMSNGLDHVRKTARRASRRVSDTVSEGVNRTAKSARKTARDTKKEAFNGASAIGHDVYDQAVNIADRSLGRVDRFVSERPVTALAGALVIGVFLGFMARN